MPPDRQSTRLNSSHTDIYPLSYTTLFRSLTALSARDREAVLLRYFEGCDYAEIGARFSVTADAARSAEHTSELQSHRYLPSFLHDALPISHCAERTRSRSGVAALF